MNIHKSQLFWGSRHGTRVLTHPHVSFHDWAFLRDANSPSQKLHFFGEHDDHLAHPATFAGFDSLKEMGVCATYHLKTHL